MGNGWSVEVADTMGGVHIVATGLSKADAKATAASFRKDACYRKIRTIRDNED